MIRSLVCLSLAASLAHASYAQFSFLSSFLNPPITTTESDSAAALQRRTYSWGEVHMAVPQYEPVVRAAVDKSLQKLGWQLVPSGGSATVFALGDVRGEPELEADYTKQGGGWGAGQWGLQGLGPGWKPGYGEPTVNALGTSGSHLVIDIFDTPSHKLVFRGVLMEDISGTEKNNTKGLQKIINKTFKKFPPKK